MTRRHIVSKTGPGLPKTTAKAHETRRTSAKSLDFKGPDLGDDDVHAAASPPAGHAIGDLVRRTDLRDGAWTPSARRLGGDVLHLPP